MEDYPALKAHLASEGTDLPAYVEQEFEESLRCGRLEHGFLRKGDIPFERDSTAEEVLIIMKTSLLMPVVESEERWLANPVWTTYFTSAWVWLYFIAQSLMRLATPLRHTLGVLQYALPMSERPLRAVGQVMAFVACVGYCSVMLPAAKFRRGALIAHLEPETQVINPGSFRRSATCRPVPSLHFSLGGHPLSRSDGRTTDYALSADYRLSTFWPIAVQT